MTIREVAKASGVSIATVSRVLNGSEKVSNEVRLAVEQAIADLNYQKPPPKRKKATKLFAVIVRNMTNPFFAQLVDVLEQEAYKHGRSILLFNSRNNLQLEKTFLLECENHKVDGVFLIPRSLKDAHLESLKEFSFPVILLTATTPLIASIGTHHQHGGALAAEHFIQQGHRQIGFIGASGQQSSRFIGFQNALNSKGRSLEARHILTPFTSEQLEAFIKEQILESNRPISAIFCSDDIVASQTFNTLKAQDSSQAELVEIIGFDDTYIAQSLGFSSISQPMKQIALLGFDMMIETIHQGQIINKEILLEPKLIIRHSPASGGASRQAEILKEE